MPRFRKVIFRWTGHPSFQELS